MAEDVKAMFERFGAQEYDPRVASIRGSYLFDIEGAGHWFVSIDNGKPYVSQEKREADCIIECPEEDFMSAFRGEHNLLTALLQGRVNIRGDMALAHRLHTFLRESAYQRAVAAGEQTA